jgi:outer membrane protein TolC
MKLFSIQGKYILLAITVCNCLQVFVVNGQEQKTLLLTTAVKNGIKNYQGIQAKQNYLLASSSIVKNIQHQYLPDVTASIQQAYGTINSQPGPAAAFGGVGISSAGPSYSSQSWNAAFGSVYLINTNWEFISFGRQKSRIDAAHAQVQTDSANLTQEKFVQGVRIAGAYLNLLIAQRLVQTAQLNVERTSYIQQSVIARTKSGLTAGVDSSIVNAEVSAARLLLIQSKNREQELSNQLSQLLNTAPGILQLDTSYFNKIPVNYNTTAVVTDNPQARFYERRIIQSNAIAKYFRKSMNPGLNLFGAFQTRGSGFDYNYTPDFNNRFNKSYLEGIRPARYNYLAGIGLSWNLISPFKINQQVKAQQYLSAAYQNEYDLVTTQLKDQLILSDQQIENSLQSMREAPLQLKAATDAYLQKTVLYKNGLTTIVDVQQALFALNRAQTDISVAYINVWQALLLKAAASGDFDLFINQVQ